MGNDKARFALVSCGVALLAAGCAGVPPPAFEGNVRPYAHPQARAQALPACPQPLVAQAHWLAQNMARVRLGTSKLQVVGIVGSPAHAETFMLNNGAMIEVLFYHTPATICRVAAHQGMQAGGLMPLVFQDDRLLGYGPQYYHDFVVPKLRNSMNFGYQVIPGYMKNDFVEEGLLEGDVPLQAAGALPPLRRVPDVNVENLPTLPPAMHEGPYGGVVENGYSEGMRNEIYPAGYYESVPTRTWLGRGDPLR